MHARDLVELAALVAVHSPAIIRGGVAAPIELLEQFWAASKCRLDRWTRVFVQLANAAHQPPLPAALAWPRMQPVFEEVLLSEMLARIWAAAATGHDALHRTGDLAPVAQNVLAGQLDARRRLLALLADGRALELSQLAHLDQLRRRVERWTDMLLAHLAPFLDIREFAFDENRAGDFADDLDGNAADSERRIACQLVVASLRSAFARHLADRTPNADLNRRIGSSLLALIRDELDDVGLAKSFWLERITRMTGDAEGMIEELLRL